MAASRIDEWWSRIPANGPWLVSVVLAVLIAVEAARIAVALLGGNPVTPIAARTAAPRIAPRAAPAPDAQSIVAAHLFGVASVDAGAQNPADAPLSTANLVLAGTIATQDPKRGLAIIAGGVPATVYSVGDAVGGASLYAVYLDRVVLDRNGSLETLKLPQIPLTGQPAPQYAMSNPVTARTLNNIRRMVQQNPGILSSVIRPVASYDSQAGKLRGFRIYPGTNRRAFATLGLRPGDLVTAINGTPLDDPQHGQQIFDTVESSSEAVVTVDRNGQTIQLTLNIAKVAAEAGRDMGPPPGGRPPGRPNFAPPNLNQ